MVYVFLTVWKVMEMCYKILGEGKLVTQRELFYKLLSDSPKYFSCQRHVNQSIQGLQNSKYSMWFLFHHYVIP
jgi:DNA topoisomerase VI subunit A